MTYLQTFKLSLPHLFPLANGKVKTKVTWHFDAAPSVQATFDTFERGYDPKGKPRHVGVPFCVGRDAKVYELYDPTKFWTYHTALGDLVDSISMGVEIENVGPLVRREDGFYWWPPNMTFRRKYCDLSKEKELVLDNGKNWRGMRYWASYTPAQLDAVHELALDLSKRFGIARTFPVFAPERLSQADIRINLAFPMYCHDHVRQDKFDLGPVFPYQCLVS